MPDNNDDLLSVPPQVNSNPSTGKEALKQNGGARKKVELDVDEARDSAAKVELDIEEFTSAEEEAPAEGEISDEPDDANEPTRENRRTGLKKDIDRRRLRSGLLLMAVSIGLAVCLIPVIVMLVSKNMTGSDQKKSPTEQSLVVNMDPFVVNFTEKGRDKILKLVMALTFSNLEAKSEFTVKQVLVRDIVYRYLLVQENDKISDKDTILLLQEQIVDLINSYLEEGKIEEVLFQELLIM